MRFHQSWWRIFVLVEKQGPHPSIRGEVIGNKITNGEISKKNFLTKNIEDSVIATLEERKNFAPGIINE